jgi:hypothetical protein
MNSDYLTRKVGVWFLGLFTAFTVAFMEEGIKYYWMRRACLINLPKPDHMSRIFIETVLSFGIMAGLGIGTGESILYTVFAIDDAWVVTGAVVYHLIWKTPFHILTGFLTACNLTRNMLMNRQYDMPWYRCIFESTLFHGCYDVFTFFMYMALLKYTSSITVILFLNFLMNGFGMFLGFRAKRVLGDELVNYQVEFNPSRSDFDDSDFKKSSNKRPEPLRMGVHQSEKSDEMFPSQRQQFAQREKNSRKGRKKPSAQDYRDAQRLANQV